MVFALPSHIGVRACRRFHKPLLAGAALLLLQLFPGNGVRIEGFHREFCRRGVELKMASRRVGRLLYPR